MAKINYSKVADASSAFALVKENITPDTMAKYKVKADFNYDEKNKVIHAKGSGFNLKMNFLADHAVIDLELSFLLKAFKQKIMESLEKQISRIV